VRVHLAGRADAVLKAVPRAHPNHLDETLRARRVVEHMRGRGYPTPAWLAVGTTATHVWHLMDFVDAAPAPELTPSLVEQLMETIELQAGQASEPYDHWSYAWRVATGQGSAVAGRGAGGRCPVLGGGGPRKGCHLQATGGHRPGQDLVGEGWPGTPGGVGAADGLSSSPLPRRRSQPRSPRRWSRPGPAPGCPRSGPGSRWRPDHRNRAVRGGARPCRTDRSRPRVSLPAAEDSAHAAVVAAGPPASAGLRDPPVAAHHGVTGAGPCEWRSGGEGGLGDGR
jgi:hypothetical protein